MRALTVRQRQILEFIDAEARSKGYPPSVREIGKAIGLTSTSTVHAHLAALERKGFISRDGAKPRAIGVRFEPSSGTARATRPSRPVPLLGEVGGGTGVLTAENVEDVYPLPEDLTGPGTLFLLRVRGESMTGAGILDGDLVVVRQQPVAEDGDIVVAGLPGDEATVKTFFRRKDSIVLRPSNPAHEDIVLPADDVVIYGKVVTLLRSLR